MSNPEIGSNNWLHCTRNAKKELMQPIIVIRELCRWWSCLTIRGGASTWACGNPQNHTLRGPVPLMQFLV